MLSEIVPIYLPADLELPVLTDAALEELNEKIKISKDLSMSLIQYLHYSASGKTVRSFTTSVLRKVLSRDMARTYSTFGRKGKKSFSKLQETLNVILTAVSLKFKDEDRESLMENFGKALAASVDWEGKRIRTSNFTRNS